MSERVLVAVPVLARPWRVSLLLEAFAEVPVNGRLLFLCSDGDNDEIAACRKHGADHIVVPWEPGRGDYAKKINLAVDASDEDWILMAADDICFCPGWLEECFKEYAGWSGARVIGTNDLGNSRVMLGKHATHSLVARSYIEELGTIDEPGKMLHEGYWHNFCDDELVETAKARGEWAFAQHSELPHHHPSWGKSKMDSTYRLGLAHFSDDSKLFRKRARLWAPVGTRT